MTHTVPDQGSEQYGQHKLRVAFTNVNWLEKSKEKYVVMHKFITGQQHLLMYCLCLLQSTQTKMSNYNKRLRPTETKLLLSVP